MRTAMEPQMDTDKHSSTQPVITAEPCSSVFICGFIHLMHPASPQLFCLV